MRPWKYLSSVLDGLPFKSSPLILDLLTLHIRFCLLNTQLAARNALLMAIRQIADVETMLLGWVQSGALRAVRVEVEQPLTTSDISWVESVLFPRLHITGALSLGCPDLD